MPKPTKRERADYRKRKRGFFEIRGQIWRAVGDIMATRIYHAPRVGPGHLAKDPEDYRNEFDYSSYETWVGRVPKQIAVMPREDLEAFLASVVERGPYVHDLINNDTEMVVRRPKRPLKDLERAFYPFMCGTDPICDYLFNARHAIEGLRELRTREVGFSVYVSIQQTALVLRSKDDVVVARGYDPLDAVPDAPVLMAKPPRAMGERVAKEGCFGPVGRNAAPGHRPPGPR